LTEAFEETTTALSDATTSALHTLQQQLHDLNTQCAAAAGRQASDAAAAAAALESAQRRLRRQINGLREDVAGKLEGWERELSVKFTAVDQLRLEVAGLQRDLEAARAATQGDSEGCAPSVYGPDGYLC